MNMLGGLPRVPDEIEPPGYEHGPMGEAGEAPHMGEVVPFPGAYQEPQPPTDLQKRVVNLMKLSELDNAAEVLDENELAKLGEMVCREYDIDERSRKEWKDMAERAMNAAELKIESKSTPWPDASNVKYPLLTTAALQFAARAYPAVVDGPIIVKGKVLGADPQGIKAAMADRVSQYMSYQFLYEMPEWEESVDTLLHQIPIIGCAFRKIYPEPLSDSGFKDDLVSAFDFVVNQKTKSLETVPRATFVLTFYPHEIRERQRAGTWSDADLELSKGDGDNNDDDAPHGFLEQHRYYDIDGDGVVEPWIVTVHKATQKVVRLRANMDLENIKVDQQRDRIIKIPKGDYCKVVKIPFLRDPKGGFYDVGFGKLLAGISDTIDTSINQMMDAGTLQNSGGGFVGGSVQLAKSKVRFRPGEYQTVPSAGDDIRKSVVNMEHPGPAPVLFQLLEMMVAAGKDVASVKDILTGETPTNQTATSTMAAIEQGLKVFTAIYKRVYRALGHEFKAVYQINRRYLDPQKYMAYFDPDPQTAQMLAGDFHDNMDVLPVADPNTVTDMQRMAKAQFLKEMLQEGLPLNPILVTKRSLEAARIEKPDELLPDPNAPPQPSPEELKTKAMADQAQIKQQAAEQAASVNLQTKMQEAQIRMAELEAKLEAKMRQMEMDKQAQDAAFEQKWRELQLQARSIEQKAVEGDIAHEHAKRALDLKAQAAESAAEGDSD